MKCQQIRDELTELLDGVRRDRGRGSLDTHLENCAECRRWYEQQRQAIRALDQLETLPVPQDFTARVLQRLPDTRPAWQPPPVPGRPSSTVWQRLVEAWSSSSANLSRPASRRRLAPALALAAVLIMVLGLLYVMQGGQPASTPGAATGPMPILVAAGLGLSVILLIVGLFLWRGKK